MRVVCLLHPVVVQTQTHSAAAAADNDDDDGSWCDVTAAHPEHPLLSTSSATWFVFHFPSLYDESFAINATSFITCDGYSYAFERR